MKNKLLSRSVGWWIATLLGILTAIVTALATSFDFTTFKVDCVNCWMKFFAIVLPILGGAFSTVNLKKPEE